MTAQTVIREQPRARVERASRRPIPLRPSADHVGSAATLETICATAGQSLLRIVIAPRGLHSRVTGARLLDQLDERPVARDELLLGVGLDGHSRDTLRALEAVADARGAGIVLRAPHGISDAMLDEAGRLGVTVLAAAPGVDWGSLHALVTSSTSREPQDARAADALGATSEDLLALVDATAALTGGPVTIEDAQLRVLAFSTCEGDLDDERVASILARRTPDRVAKQLRETGVVGRVAAAEDVVAFTCNDMRPRRAIAIRAGGLVLGYIWVVEMAHGLSAHADAALREAARLAAPLLLRHRIVTDLERRVRGDLLRALLNGHGPGSALAAELALPQAEEYTVVAYELACSDHDEAALLEGRTVDFISMCYRSHRRVALVVADGSHVYALVLAEDAQPREALARIVRESVASMRQAFKLHPHAGIGTTVRSLADVPESRRAAAQALRVGEGDKRGRVVDIEDVRGESFLMELAEYVAGHPRPLAKPLIRLQEHDRVNGTDYLETLTVYLDCFGNSALAAQRLHIHPNTLRYRVRRLMELGEVDLEEPAQRFAIEAQLRLPALALLQDG